jgi:hypothetical protein
MFKKIIALGSFALCIAAYGPSAHAFGIAGVVGGDLSTLSISPASSGIVSGSKFGFGIGALASMDVFPGFEAELGALYMARSVSQTLSTLETDITANSLIIPLQLRFTALPFISFGAGVYFADNLSFSSSSGTVGGTFTSNATTTGFSSTDFGALVSARFRMPILPTIGAFLDARYLIGLANEQSPSVSGQSYHINGLELLAGVGFSI